MRSDPKSHTELHTNKTGDDGTGLDWHNNRRLGSFAHLEPRGSAATSSDIPLVHVGSKAQVGNETLPADSRVNGPFPEPMENGNGNVIRGFDAV